MTHLDSGSTPTTTPARADAVTGALKGKRNPGKRKGQAAPAPAPVDVPAVDVPASPFHTKRVRVQASTLTEGQKMASEMLAKVVLPADLVSEIRAIVRTVPGVGQVVLFSTRYEGQKWKHEVIPVAVSRGTSDIVQQLLVESARVSLYERQLDGLSARIADIAQGKRKGDVSPLKDKKETIMIKLKGSRAKCATYREEMGLNADAYRSAVKWHECNPMK